MTTERKFRRWMIVCPVCGKELKDWTHSHPGVRDSEPKEVIVLFLRHLSEHPDAIEKLDLDQGCPVCGKEFPSKVPHRAGSKTMRALAPKMRWGQFATHYGTKHPDRLKELLEQLGLPQVEPQPVEVSAAELGGLPREAQSDEAERLQAEGIYAPRPTEGNALALPVHPSYPSRPESPPEPELPAEPARPTEPAGPEVPEVPAVPEGPGEPPAEAAEEGEDEMERGQLTEVMKSRIRDSHREEDEEVSSSPAPVPRRVEVEESNEKEEPKGHRWWLWGLVGAGAVAILGLLAVVAKRRNGPPQPQDVPAGSTQSAGEGQEEPSPPPSPTVQSAPKISPVERRKLEKLPPKLRQMVESGQMSLDEVLAIW